MGLTDPCSSYSSVLLNAAVVSENSRSSRSCPCRIPFSSAASSAGWRFVFGRWRKRSIALSRSAMWELGVRVGSAPTTILCKSTEHTFVCQLASPLLTVRFDDWPHVEPERDAHRAALGPNQAVAVQTYRNAPLCPAAPTSSVCYTLVSGTLTNFSISHGKSGDTTEMTLQLPDGIRSTWAKTSAQQEDALHVGAQVQARFYQGALTTIYLGSSIGIQTKDNPIYKQNDMRFGAVVIPLLGLTIAVVTFITLRAKKPLKLGPIPTIDPTLPVEEEVRLLRHAVLGVQPAETPAGSQASGVTLPFVLRPHPIPTGRPWWVSLLGVALFVLLLLLQFRTPGSIAQVVLVATVTGMVAGVVLHWLYRNRRMLVVDDFTVRRVNLFGLSRVVSRSDVARVACPVVISFALPSSEPRLLLLDASGRCLLGVRRYYPTDDEAVQVAGALRVPLDMNLASRLTSASRLRRTVPGAVSWVEAHPYLTILGLLLPMLVLASLVVWVL